MNNQNRSIVLLIIAINIGVFVLQLFFFSFFNWRLEGLFALNPLRVVENYWGWQIATYMFLHSPVNFFHILFNMYLLWMFGMPVEIEWGGKGFAKYYFFSGIGAGLSILLLNYFQAPMSHTIGASGAVFALLLAYGVIYPNHEILLFFVIPLKAKYLVFLYGVLELMLMFSSPGSNISHIGHIGGLVFGFIYFVLFKRAYLFPRSQANQTLEIIQEIKQKVDEIKDKAMDNSRDQLIAQSQKISDRSKNGEITQEDKEFLDSLKKSIPWEERKNICEAMDFSEKDDYCRHCEYFNLCLYRKTTGHDVKKD